MGECISILPLNLSLQYPALFKVKTTEIFTGKSKRQRMSL